MRLIQTRGIPEMDDYSLQNVSSQRAKVGDKLTTHDFGRGTLAYDDASGFPEARIVILSHPGDGQEESGDRDRAEADSQKRIASVD
jgi:hypothetical protein